MSNAAVQPQTDTPQRPRVLLVDDKRPNLMLLKNILEPMELEFFIAQNGHDALELVAAHDFDLILLDTLMPGIDGYEVCRRIKAHETQRDTPVVLLSASLSHEEMIRGFESGADDYLIKPLYHREVYARARLHLNKRTTIMQLKRLLRRSYHELYNPLAVIETSAQLYALYNESNHHVDTMHAAAKSLHVIYEDLYYALSSNKEGHMPMRIDLGAFIDERLAFFTLLAQVRGLHFERSIPSGEIEVFLPRPELQRVLDNTLSNAIKYAYEFTPVQVTVESDERVWVHIRNHGHTIRDTGAVFDPGYREAFERTGMGLGLEIVASICRRNDVAIRVDSKDRLTTFSYGFPRYTPPVKRPT